MNGTAERHGRSLAKAVSWRTLGSIDTFLLGFLFTGSVSAAGAIASTEVLTKLLLYYAHERCWALVRWGTDHADNSRSVEQTARPTGQE